MKNKIKLKRYLIKTMIVSLCLLFLFLIINVYEYHTYTKNFNNKIGAIVSILLKEYPAINENQIIKILNNDENNATELLEKYGIDMDNNSIIKSNDKEYHKFLIINISSMLLTIILLVLIFLNYNKDKDNDIKNITKCIEEINKKNYELNIDSMSEDELSILKNEIYKTTVMLKEAADNSNMDKINLKKSLEDISHQLKTPLTSILVMLDNLIDDPDMDKEIREDFIRDIKRNITNINFLVQSILKLSKFDANTIKFIKEKKLLKDIINEAIKNVSTLCDLKNIELNIKGDNNAKITCDFMWQVEAITNIIKNCVEHSSINSKIDIFYEQNNAYSVITIKDYGDGIDENDISHIFERFYKGKNSSLDSIGIGLALSKTIIENDNGVVGVESDETGTKFIIKYFSL